MLSVAAPAVPEAITAFLDGDDFEDVIRTAVSLGGDCDTLTCIAGGMAEAFYGIPIGIIGECLTRVDDDLQKVIVRFDSIVRPGREDKEWAKENERSTKKHVTGH